MFYDIRGDLTYNALITIAMGGRGIGKSYSTQDFILKRYLTKGDQFIHLRRNNEDIKRSAEKYFDKIWYDKFATHSLSFQTDTYLIDDKPAGYAIPLSLSNKLKSVPFHRVKTIVFEEFLSDGNYLSNEPFKLMEFLETVIRLRDDVRLIMLSNGMSRSNPYFLTWNLPYPNIGQRVRHGEFLIHRIRTSDDYIAAKANTRLGKLSKDVGYNDYLIGNEFALDDELKVEKPEAAHNYFCSIIIGDICYGVIINLSNAHTIITARGDANYPCKIMLKPGLARKPITSSGRQSVFNRRIYGALLNDTLFYDSEKTQAEFRALIPYFL